MSLAPGSTLGPNAIRAQLGHGGMGVVYAPVLYRDGAGITRVSRERFADLVESGSISQETVVFDNTVTTAGAVRDGRWELPAANSWHGRAFF